MFRTSNPAAREEKFRNEAAIATGETMTVSGAVNKTGFLFLILLATASFVWYQYYTNGSYVSAVPLFMMAGLLGGFILSLVCIFAPRSTPFTAPLYAAAEGLFIGGISAILNTNYPGIAPQAAACTLGVLVVMLALYRIGVIKVTDKFRMIVVAATGAIFLVYLMTFLLGMFGVAVPYIHSARPIGIGINIVIIIVAALNLALDFDLFERGEQVGAPKYMEWYAGFALLLTLIWLYIEFLRLLSRLRR